LSKGRNFVRHCCQERQQYNNVEATFDFVEAIFHLVERIVRLVAFGNVASTLLLVGGRGFRISETVQCRDMVINVAGPLYIGSIIMGSWALEYRHL